MRIAITGATGLVGSALADHLEAPGHDVHRVRRAPSDDRLADWNPAVGWLRTGALDGMDAVVHLAGAPIAGDTLRNVRWTRARRELLRTSRVDATRLLVDHLRKLPNPPSTFIAVSAIGYYGDRGADLLTEDAPPGQGFLPALARDWERESMRAALPVDGRPGMRTVIFRNGHVLAGKGGLLARLIPTVRLGLAIAFGDGRQYISWIAIDDLTRAIEHALVNPPVEGIYNATSPNPVTQRQFIRAIARALRRPAPLAHPAVPGIPAFVLRLLLGPGAGELTLHSQRVHPTRLEAAGFTFRYPMLDEALSALLPRRRALVAGADASRTGE